MRLFSKIMLVFVLIVVMIVLSAYFFWTFAGKTFLAKQIQAQTGRKTTIANVFLYPPFNLEIKNIDIEGIARADSVFIVPSILGYLAGQIAFNEVVIVKPQASYVKATSETQSQPASAGQKPPQSTTPRFFIRKLTIKGGTLDLTDKDITKEGLLIKVSDVDVDLENIYSFPTSVITEFHVRGRVGSRAGQKAGALDAIGWINLFKKDMKAALTIDDLDGIYFSPYYSQWLDLEKARIENARVKFTSDIQGANNEVTANCRLEFTELTFRKREPEEKKERQEMIARAVVDIFKSMDKNQIVLDFTVKTKINSPTINFSEIKMAFIDKVNSGREGLITIDKVVKTPSKVIGGTVEGLADVTKAVISSGASIGKELKSAIEGAFTKEPAPQPPTTPAEPTVQQPVDTQQEQSQALPQEQPKTQQ